MSSFQLQFDILSYTRVSGWAYLPQYPKETVVVDILDSASNVLVSGKTDIFREDLKKAGIGDGNHAFELKGNFRNAAEARVHIPVTVSTPDFEGNKIHANDYIFEMMYENQAGFLDKGERAIQEYMSDGRNSAEKLKFICKDVLNIKKDTIKLLEFSSGYGCVTRHIEPGLFDVTSCDINPEAIEHVGKKFGVKTILAPRRPKEIKPEQKYDVVFALTFFSHVNEENFGKWLKALYECVVPGGYLIFTAHGETSNKNVIKAKLKDGFYFKQHAKGVNIPIGDNGVSVSTYDYVNKVCKEHLKCNMLSFREAYWWQHEDLYIIKKHT